MKAIIYHEHGSADVLKLEEVEKPAPKDNEILIKVHSAALNPLDWRLMKGEPKAVRLVAKAMSLSGGRPGVDVAGEVEAVGANVKQFKVGDQVFGGCRGALAEYVCTGESKVVIKPPTVSFAQAASINVAGLTALQGLRDHGRLQAGQTVLINGAAGGVGTFAVQIAKHLGAKVTGVCSTKNLETVKSIGADDVIDYTKEDFANLPERYDVILECVGNKSPSECQRVLKPNGKCVGVGAPHDVSTIDLLIGPVSMLAASMFSDRKVKSFIAKSNPADLTLLGELVASGELTPLVDVRHGLNETAEAMRYLESGHARGKVVIQVSGGQ